MPTPFGLFPDVNLSTVAQDLITGAQTGWQDFESDITAEINEVETGGLSALLGSSSDTSGTSSITLPELLAALSSDLSSPEAFSTTLNDIVNTLSGAVSTAYSTLVPTADVANALLTTLPTYDLTLFLNGIQEAADGNLSGLVDAIGNPIAADEALIPLAGLIDFAAIVNAAQTVASDLATLVP